MPSDALDVLPVKSWHEAVLRCFFRQSLSALGGLSSGEDDFIC